MFGGSGGGGDLGGGSEGAMVVAAAAGRSYYATAAAADRIYYVSRTTRGIVLRCACRAAAARRDGLTWVGGRVAMSRVGGIGWSSRRGWREGG